MSLLREWDSDRPIPQWRYRILAVEPTGRITLPPEARQLLGSESCDQAATRSSMLAPLCRGVGASLGIDRTLMPRLLTRD